MSTLLTILALVLAAVAIGQIVRIFELSNAIKGVDENEITDKDNDRQGWLMLLFMLAMLIGFTWMTIDYWDVMLPKSASAHGVDVDRLMSISMIVIIAVFFVTQPLLFYFAFIQRKQKETGRFHLPQRQVGVDLDLHSGYRFGWFDSVRTFHLA